MRGRDGFARACVVGCGCVAWFAAGLVAGVDGEPPNLAEDATATESSVWNVDSPGFEAIDGRVENDGRWVSSNIPGPHTLVLDLPEPATLGSYHMWMGIEVPRANGDQFPVRNFELQWLDGQTWRTIAGSEVVNNDEPALAIAFDAPVTASSFRLFATDNGFVRVREILLFGPVDGGGSPELGVGIFEPSDLPDPTAHPVLLNQIGFDTGGAKRFTAPLTMDGSAFEVIETGSQQVVFSGVVNGNLGDFSAFEPAADDLEYVVRVSGLRSDGEAFDDGESYPFEIGRMLMLRRLIGPALGFNIDARAVVSTHPSSSGGGAWRDGSWFTHEMPSLAMQYMAHPGYYESAASEIDLQAEGAYVLAPGFMAQPSFNDEEIPGTAQTYHQTYVNSLSDSASDLAKMLHWTAGMLLIDPVIEVFNNPVEGQIYNQTVEQMAFFLRVYPELPAGDIDIAFYEEARDQTVQWWSDVGLFDIVTFVGDEKGEDAPGHSIMPNLLMHEVALRDGLTEAQAFLDAAVAQTAWLIAEYDPTDKAIAKGQRVSEHKFYTGLAMLLAEYPDDAPAGLAAWLDAWIDNAVSLSDNMYDFRKYDEVQWTLPSPWNEPGNIAACAGILSAIEGAGIDGLGDHADRLAQLRASHFDNLFGRNPVGKATSGIPGSDFPGVDTWWPRIYTGPFGWLDLCRGVINSCAATEHYPYEFRAPYRHAEGWVAHNSGLNVSLAYLSRDAVVLELLDAAGEPIEGDVPTTEFRVRLSGPFEPGMIGSPVAVQIVVGGVEQELVATVDSVTSATTGVVHRGSLGLNEPGVDASLAYGIGFLASETTIAGACGADLAPPAGVLDLADINAFVTGFTGANGPSDLNGDGVYDLGDIALFVSVFVNGCG